MNLFKKTPVHCGQDLKGLVGCKIVEVISNEIDLDVRVKLWSDKLNDGVTLELDTLCFDGETMFLRQEINRDLDSVPMHDISQKEVASILRDMILYDIHPVLDEEGKNIIGYSHIYRTDTREELSKFRNFHVYRDGSFKISSEY